MVEVEVDGRLVCHECGQAFEALGVHVGMVHEGVAAYRRAHGLPRSVSLVSAGLRERLAASGDAEDAARVMADALARVRGVDLLAAVRRSVGDVEAAEAALVRARAGRDSLLRAAHSGGVKAKALGEATGWVGSKRSRLHQVLGQE